MSIDRWLVTVCMTKFDEPPIRQQGLSEKGWPRSFPRPGHGLALALAGYFGEALDVDGNSARKVQALGIWGGSRFVFYLAAGTQDNDILWMAAEMLATAIRLNPNVSDYIISLMLKEGDRASIDVLLDHLTEKHPDQGSEVVKAMLARTEQGGIATWIRELLRNGALELAGEMLRQASESDPNGSWNLVAHAVEDGNGNLEAAISILDHIA